MKMGAGIFWGAFLLLLGVALIIKVVFQVDFPIFKVVLGIFLVLLGFKVLFGRVIVPNKQWGPDETVFHERTYDDPEPGKEYTVLFGKGVYDFTDVDLSQGHFHAKISAIFGGAQIIVPRDVPVRIKAEAVFAGAELPDGNTSVFGDTVWESDEWDGQTPGINLKAEVVFGGIQVLRR